MVDGNSGEVLNATNADAPRHPASLTKIMTLYCCSSGSKPARSGSTPSSRCPSTRPSRRRPNSGSSPGQTIVVDDAIKAVVTKSANDAAVTIAENLGGDEDEFARLMTQKARALGMSRTTYVNASGLPDDDQITTARDQALLGRAIQERFPALLQLFLDAEFVYHGREMRNHNHLLGEVGGVDGIKTGYTRASGFNLVTSVHRDGRYIVAVVLGGRSASERDERMRELIGAHIREAALRHTAPPVAGKIRDQRGEAAARRLLPRRASTPRRTAPGRAEHRQPRHAQHRPPAPATRSSRCMVRTITYRTAPGARRVRSPRCRRWCPVSAASPPAPRARTRAQSAPPRPVAARARTEPHRGRVDRARVRSPPHQGGTGQEPICRSPSRLSTIPTRTADG